MKKETVNHPEHYLGIPARCEKCGEPIECISVVRHLDFNLGNAMKYIWRADFKGDSIENLEKAIWYIQDEIKLRINQSAKTEKKLNERQTD